MKIIAGLGNPGREYRDSRHNAGFRIVAALADESGIALSAGRGDFMSGAGRIARSDAMLVLPLTYMNESGRALLQMLEASGADASELIVVCDDVYLDPGRIRIRRGGGDGGHNGLSSVIYHLQTEDFARVRFGVGAPPEDVDMADYVLEPMPADELAALAVDEKRAAEAVCALLADGIDRAMNIYNRRAEPPGSESL